MQCQRPSTFLVLALFVPMRRFVIKTMRLVFVCTSGLWTLPFMVLYNTPCYCGSFVPYLGIKKKREQQQTNRLCWQTTCNQDLHVINVHVSIVHVCSVASKGVKGIYLGLLSVCCCNWLRVYSLGSSVLNCFGEVILSHLQYPLFIRVGFSLPPPLSPLLSSF